VLIHPVVLAKTGQRMSKSLGTGVDPLELIEAHGADATRFGLMHQMSFDMQQMKFDPEAIKAAQNFANKIWNIARLLDGLEEREEETLADQWIQMRMSAVAKEVTALLEEYHIGEAARVVQDFVWYEFADWYIEIVKKEGSVVIARSVFADILKLLHPFMPFITEVVWGHVGNTELLITASWKFAEYSVSEEVMSKMHVFQSAVRAMRSARILFSIPMGSVIDVYVSQDIPMGATFERMARVAMQDNQADTMRSYPLASGGLLWISSNEITQEAIAKGRARLDTQINKIQVTVQITESILKNMAGKAPEEKIEEKQNELTALQQQLQDVINSRKLLD
jgi:valyl-tRNA synthetase